MFDTQWKYKVAKKYLGRVIKYIYSNTLHLCSRVYLDDWEGCTDISFFIVNMSSCVFVLIDTDPDTDMRKHSGLIDQDSFLEHS